jgi:hypothetical protein
MQEAIGEMTDGQLRFTRIERRRTPDQTRFSPAELPEGTMIIMAAKHLGANGRAMGYAGNNPFVLVRGTIFYNLNWVDACSADWRTVFLHELGHALGYALQNHVLRISSIMGSARALTQFDRDVIAIVYQRTPGNRTPDVDPDGYTTNLRASTRALPLPIP